MHAWVAESLPLRRLIGPSPPGMEDLACLDGRNLFLPEAQFEGKVFVEKGQGTGIGQVWWEWRYIHSFLEYKEDRWEWLRKRKAVLDEMHATFAVEGPRQSSKSSGSSTDHAHALVSTSWLLALLIGVVGTFRRTTTTRKTKAATLLNLLVLRGLAHHGAPAQLTLPFLRGDGSLVGSAVLLDSSGTATSECKYWSRGVQGLMGASVTNPSLVDIAVAIQKASLDSMAGLSFKACLPVLVSELSVLADGHVRAAALQVSRHAPSDQLLRRLKSTRGNKYQRLDADSITVVASAKSAGTAQSPAMYIKSRAGEAAFAGCTEKTGRTAEHTLVRQHLGSCRDSFGTADKLWLGLDESKFDGESTMVIVGHVAATGKTAYLPLQVLQP